MNSVILTYICIVLIITVIFLLISDYTGPRRIFLHPDNVFGFHCFTANNLVVQEFDSQGDLWASRGMIIYRLKKGENNFTKMVHIPSGFSLLWFNNFDLIRKIMLKSECIEMTVIEGDHLCVLSAGFMWDVDICKREIKKTLKLPNYGPGVGRGILSNGLLRVNNIMFFGEYFRNDQRKEVKVFRRHNSEQNWSIAHKFDPGEIRHIHALQSDPFTGKLWICTGDEDCESMIGWSNDYYKSIFLIGSGNQSWRTCQLVFTEEAVYWGTDTGSEDLAGIYRWDKQSMKLVKLAKTDGAVFYGTRLSNGTIIMSSDREGFPNERDDMTRLYILSENDKIISVRCGTWNYKKSDFRSSFAKLRLQRNQGNDSLVVTCFNQKEISESELIIYSEEVLSKVIKGRN